MSDDKVIMEAGDIVDVLQDIQEILREILDALRRM